MAVLSALEQAVLDTIALHVPEIADALAGQQGNVRVTARKNTGAGCYTTLDFAHRLIEGVTSPVGHVGATVVGLEHGMGFILWLREGHIHELEGFTYGESTVGIDFERVAFAITFP
jgi:ABC-type enterobactin transport system permease subunit